MTIFKQQKLQGVIKKFSRSLFCFIIVFFLVLSFAHAQETKDPLTLRVGVYNNQPKIYVEDGIAKGFWADITNYIVEQEGWDIEYVDGNWAEGLDRLEAGEIDLMVDVAVTDTRKEKYDFTTEAVIASWTEIYSEKDADIENFLDLEDKDIGVLKGSVNYVGEGGIKELLDNFDIDVNFVEFDSYDKVFEAVKDGTADAGVTNMIYGGANREKYGLKRTPIMFRPSRISFAFSKARTMDSQLIERIDYHMSQLKEDPDSIYYKSIEKHFFGAKERYVLILTEEEQAWLDEHKDIRIGIDPAFAPFEFITEKGAYKGIAADHMKLIGERLGIKLEHVKNLSWKEVIEKAKLREIDVLPAVGITEERKQYLNYSEPYLSFPRVIIIRSSSEAGSLEDLEDLKVAVQAESSHHGFIKEQTTLDPILYNTFQHAMVALSGGEVDAVIGNLAVATHTIQESKLTNLKIGGYTSKESSSLAVAIRKDWPELVSIFNKALYSISDETRIKLMTKWVPVEYAPDLLPKITRIKLTEEEKEWLEEHPAIIASSETDWPPFDFHIGGEPAGFSIDYLNLVAEKTGLNIEYRSDIWSNILQMVREKEMDLLQSTSKTPERSEYLLFTKAYVDSPMMIFMRVDSEKAESVDDILDKRIAVVEGYSAHEDLAARYPEVELVFVDSTLGGLEAVSLGKADAFISWLSVANYVIKTNFINDVIPTAKFEPREPEQTALRFAVRDDWPELVTILEKGMDAVSSEEYNQLVEEWFILPPTAPELKLTEEEKAWLEEHKDIRIGADSDWPPFDFFDDLGEHQGMCSDYGHKVGAMLNVNLSHPREMSWDEMMQKSKKGEIDVIPCIVKTEERSEYLLFTEPYLKLPNVLVTRDDMPLLGDFSEMEGKKIAVIKGFADEEWLKKDFPNIIQVPVANSEEALEAVSDGRVDGTINTFAAIKYTSQRLGIKNLKISATSPYTIELSFGVRKDWPEMVELLEKALLTISDEDKKGIQDKWITALVEAKIDFGVILRYVLGFVFPAVIIIGLFWMWNRKLSKEIEGRQKAENELQEKVKDLERFTNLAVGRELKMIELKKRIKELEKNK